MGAKKHAFAVCSKLQDDLFYEAAADRMKIVSETSGVARCHTIFNCTMACPRDIQITKAIGELKMATITGKVE